MSFSYKKRVFKEPSSSYFLFGPRGTGKSTMAAERHPEALSIDLRIAATRRAYQINPDNLLDLVRAQPTGKTIIIDEIQNVPELLSLVHILIEEKKRWKFILTGSSARKLKHQAVDLLGGRALKEVLHPFIAYEIRDDFSLDDALTYGMLPLRFDSPDPAKTLNAYIDLYLDEEIKAEGLVRSIEPFSRFLQTMSFSHGSILNITNIARDAAVKRTTVASWIAILEELMIGYQIPIFTQRAKRALSAHPKFYFFDTGVYKALRPHSSLNGAGLEGLVAQHLVAWRDYTSDKHTVSFWRTRAGNEVDFIIHGPLGFWAIEVKNSKDVHTKDLRGLKEFVKDYPEAKPIMLYRGEHRLLKQDILCIPVEEFLLDIQPDIAIV